ncbi:MAG: NAD-dependent epimerase/dehydratase family protein [Propionibacteriaceae bacterium]|nr:NAD-dependent epimerase/dehydratase family protein [Propionibacteriaceae bacterium]
MNRKVLLIGGTGAIGTYLAPQLVRAGYDVCVTTRHQIQSSDSSIGYVRGDGHDVGFLDRLKANDSYSAVVDFMHYSTIDFSERVDRLLSLSPHYFFLSSYRVFADAAGLIVESSPRLLDVCKDHRYMKSDEYALAKARQEDILMKEKNRPWTIVRPAVTYSKRRFQLGVLETNLTVSRALLSAKTIIAAELLNKFTTMTWAGDVAWMIAELIDNPNAIGEAFNVSTSEYHTWEEVADIYKTLFGLDYTVIPLDAYIAVTKRAWQLKYDRLYDRQMDNSKILSLTGRTSEDMLPLYKGLERELAAIDQPQWRGEITNWEQHAELDFASGSRISLTEVPDEAKTRYFNRLEKLQQTKQMRDLGNVYFHDWDVLIPTSSEFFHVLLETSLLSALLIITRKASILANPGPRKWLDFRLKSPLVYNNWYELTVCLADKSPELPLFLRDSQQGSTQRISLHASEQTNSYNTFKYVFLAQANHDFITTTSTWWQVGLVISVSSIHIKMIQGPTSLGPSSYPE